MVRSVWTLTLAASLWTAPLTGGPWLNHPVPSDDDDKKPTMVLRATPNMAFAPARVVASADIRGGLDANEDLYCAGVEWDWGDGTKSEATIDCDPYEPGRSEIKRRYVGDHRYNYSGRFRIQLRLKRGSRVVLSAQTNVMVRPGPQEFGPY